MKPASLSRLALALVLVAAGACSRDPRARGWEYMPNMAHSVPYDTFAPNPATRDGKTLLAPAPGTIPRGFLPFHYGPGPEEAERAGRELRNPFPATPEVLARGKKLYQTFCWVCHGDTGQGDGPLIPLFPAPPAYDTGAVKDYPAGRIFHVITRGSGRMPSYATQIVPDDRWRLIHYVQLLQRGKEVKP